MTTSTTLVCRPGDSSDLLHCLFSVRCWLFLSHFSPFTRPCAEVWPPFFSQRDCSFSSKSSLITNRPVLCCRSECPVPPPIPLFCRVRTSFLSSLFGDHRGLIAPTFYFFLPYPLEARRPLSRSGGVPPIEIESFFSLTRRLILFLDVGTRSYR